MRNFFEHQERARRSTRLLIGLYCLAIVVIGVLLWCVLLVTEGRSPEEMLIMLPFFIGGTALVVGAGSLFKTWQLKSGGGASVAEMLGGQLLRRDGPLSHQEKQLLNVVEEMAISSGVKVPPVYLLEEEGINAFAAGYDPNEAVIGITRGCVNALNRPQLQGVIAHEFSHILNGDMALNIRLMGVLFGLVMLSVLGRIVVRTSFFTGGSRNRKGGGSGGIIIFGLALLVLGMIGAFIGQLIQAAVSRQREYLADASAVQFTRNPDGIAGALKVIGAHSSRLKTPRAAEAAHMLFSSPGSLYASHPPIQERIRRLDPNWDGKLPKNGPPPLPR